MEASKSEEESEWLWRQRKNLRRLGFKSDEIERSEFDFGPIPDEEVEACCFCEYARESASVIHSVLRWRHSAKSAGNTRQAKLATYHASPDDKQLKMGTGEDSVVKLTKSDFVTCNTNQAIGGQALASGNAPSSYMVAKIPTAAELHSKGKFWMAPILASIATFPGSTWQSLSDEERIYLKSFGEKVKSLIDPILDFQIDEGMGKDSVSEWKKRHGG